MRSRWVAMTGAVALLAGCGAGGGAAPRDPASIQASRTTLPAVDVCAAIDAATLSLALGQQFAPGRATGATASTMGQCDFDAGSGGATPIRHVYIAARPDAAFDSLAQAYPSQVVPGVGTGAVFGSKMGLLVRLSDRPYFLQIAAVDAAGDLVQAQAVAIARACVARL